MSLTAAGTIEIPNAQGTSFDHGALEPETRRVFIAHTARDCLEVVDADSNQHLATLQGFPGAAGVVASNGRVLVTNRGGASLASVDARSLKTLRAIQSGQVRREWPLAGVPDATFFNPTSGLVHVAIEDPGLIQTVDPRSGSSTQFTTAIGAKTTALVEPNRLYVFSASHGGILDLEGA
jgi:hypothetical protein